MDLTQFPEHLHTTFKEFLLVLEDAHRGYPDIVVKFIRTLVSKYGLGEETGEIKHYVDGSAQTDTEPQEAADSCESAHSRLHAEQPHELRDNTSKELPNDGQDQQVWDLKSLADDVRAVAQETLNNYQSQSFVYDERSGTYYNYDQQCHYIPQYKLYYYVQNKAYYTFDEKNNCMKFYSSVIEESDHPASSVGVTDEKPCSDHGNSVLEAAPESSAQPLVEQNAERNRPSKPVRPEEDELEEGEIVDSEDEEEEYVHNASVKSPQAVPATTPSVITASPTRIDLNVEPVDHCAPCVRITVRETKTEGVDVGQLFIITRSGGTLGRDEKQDISLPDVNVSKEHLSFRYRYCEGMDVYEIVDCSTKNGTMLDGCSLEHDKPYRLDHGSVLKVGSTTLLCHIHEGTQTCEECEPSCLGFMTPASPPQSLTAPYSSLKERHAAEITQIKRKFGLNGSFVTPKLPKGYEDKSKIRRETVGSSHDSEKTDAGSTEEPIRSDNKGYAMLAKMGWKKGEAVGKSGVGTKAPVNVTVKMSKRGLGCPEDELPSVKPKSKMKALEITKKRYEKCE